MMSLFEDQKPKYLYLEAFFPAFHVIPFYVKKRFTYYAVFVIDTNYAYCMLLSLYISTSAS